MGLPESATKAERGLDAEDCLLRRRMFLAAVALLASHISDNPSDRPKVVREVIGLLGSHAEDGLGSAPSFDCDGIVERFLGELAGASLPSDPEGASRDGGNYGFHNPIIPNVSSGAKS
jgi:hypothetical protein